MDTKLQNLKMSFRKAVDPSNILSILAPRKIKTTNLLIKTLLLSFTGSGSLLQASNQNIVKSRKGMLRCLALFNRRKLLDAIPDNGQIQLNVVATLNIGQYLYATDYIKIK